MSVPGPAGTSRRTLPGRPEIRTAPPLLPYDAGVTDSTPSALSTVRGDVRELERGGYYVATRVGAVQFGMPPETVKDVMALELEVPVLYILPRELFDRRRGLSVAEFEFPAYYNFFLLQRKARMGFETPDVEARVRAIFQETLFGPRGSPHPSEFADGYPVDARPDFARESEYFRSVPGRKRIEVDDLVDFVPFVDGRLEVGPGVVVTIEGDMYAVSDGGNEIARIPRTIRLPLPEASVELGVKPFQPPAFGVTVLGASHGFDPKGKTTGFLLWVGGRALLVDPPTDSTEYLAARGVAPKMIDGVIVTHCHADHDAGTFQKLLEEGQINLYTTPFILGSFLRKYAALSGLSEDILRRTFVFNPVRIGAPCHVRGGELWFRYTLHSIPSIGVEAFYGGRSIAISGDTLYDPGRIGEMYEANTLGHARYVDLVTFRSHHSIYLHEAGIPPLHTPSRALAELPEEVKRRLFLVHIAAKDVPKGMGLRPAAVGLEHTYRVETMCDPEFAEAVSLLEAVAMVDFMRDLPLSRARHILQRAQRLSLPAGEKIVAQGTRGDSFYIVVNGQVLIVRDGVVLKTYRAGDYFGETALLLDQPRSADVVAQTQVDLIAIDRTDFLALLRGTQIPDRLLRLARVREEGTWEILESNSVLSALSSGQKTQLMSFMNPAPVARGALLWMAGREPPAAFLVGDAQVSVDGADAMKPFAQGAVVGEFDALLSKGLATTSAKVLRDGTVFRLEAEDLRRFFEENPGVRLSFLGTRFVE